MEHSLDERTVREHVVAYLQGEASLDELKSWLVAVTWDRSKSSSIAGVRLADEIKLSLAEHSGGFLSDALLRDDLINIVDLIESDVRKIDMTSDAALPSRVRAAS